MIGNYLRCYCDHRQEDWDQLLVSAEFAYNSSNIDSMNISPFELDLSWILKSPLRFLSSTSSQTESINELRKRLEDSYEDAKFSQKLAQARYASYNTKKYTPRSYGVGDQVWLSRKYFADSVSNVQKSRKLGVKRYRPFKVIQLVGKTRST